MNFFYSLFLYLMDLVKREDFIYDLIFEVFIIIISVLLVTPIKKGIDKIRYHGWFVTIIKNGENKVNRPISYQKLKEIKNESAEMSVFIKGVASPYGFINCDILEDGLKQKIFIIDEENKKLIYDFDKQKKDKKGEKFYLEIDFEKQNVKLKNEHEKPKEF